MKIKVESEKIIKAVEKLAGVELVLEDVDDAKEAISLILSKPELYNEDDQEKLKEVKVTGFQEYKTSAVDYKMVFLLEFVFEEGVSRDSRVSLIKRFQGYFEKI
ncbi:hypothetical protein ACFL4N_00510 [Thermodesulfobacteriota bacterium]